MQKITQFLFVAISVFYFSVQAEELKKNQWFNNKNCNELSIYKHKSISDDRVLVSTAIKEKSAIDEIIKRIEALPAEGDKYISFGKNAKRTVLKFSCADSDLKNIEIINSKFKTPATSFISSKNKNEQDLVRDIEALVQPSLKKRFIKLKNHPIKIKDFTITFLEDIHMPQPDDGSTVGPTHYAVFMVNPEASPNQTVLKILSGQVPPSPQAFVVGKKIYYLLTYESLAQERLYPDYFQISEKAQH